jgi:hypothetical protein
VFEMKRELEELKMVIERHRREEIDIIQRLITSIEEPSVVPSPPRRLYMDEVIDIIVVESAGKPISTDDVICEYYKRTGKSGPKVGRAASQAFNKFKQRTPSELEVVTPGAGRRGGVYRYIGPSPR